MKKDVVIFEPYPSTPITSGGQNRIYNTINVLSKKFSLNLVTVQELSKETLSFLKYGIPYWFSGWKKTPDNIPSSSCYIVEFTQLLHLIENLPSRSQKIFVAYDVSTISYWRRLHEVNMIKKIIHLLRLVEVYFYEKKYIPKYDVVIAVSQTDAEYIKKLFNPSKIIVCPNGVSKIDILPKTQGDTLKIGYIGDTTHPPNLAAINFLLYKISPELKRRNIKHKIVLLSDISPHMPQVVSLPHQQDISKFYKKIDILVAPIFSGSGSRIKIIESLSFGIPVITTAIGAEGISINSNYLTIIKDNNLDVWLNAITNISISMTDIQGLKKSLQAYTWENTLKPLLLLLEAK